VIFQNVYFSKEKPKRQKNTNKNKEKYFLFWEKARQGWTLLLGISI